MACVQRWFTFLPLLLGVGSFLFLLPSGVEANKDLVTIDCAVTEGPVSHRASGILGGMDDNLPDYLFYQINPSMVRDLFTTRSTKPNPGQWERVTRIGAVAVVTIPWNLEGPCPTCDEYGDEGKCYVMPGSDCWIDRVRIVINTVRQVRERFPTLDIRYDVWNEPDNLRYWNASPEHDNVDLYLEVWDSTVARIRKADPHAVIIGPSFAGGVDGRAPFAMEAFLSHGLENNSLPDVLSWHAVDDESILGSIDAQVRRAVEIAEPYGITRFEIDEMMGTPYLTPGHIVRRFATVERSTRFGLECAGRAFHRSEDEGRLAGLVTTSGETRYAWWTYRAYADMGDTLLKIHASPTLDGLAAKEQHPRRLRILIGRYKDSGSGTAHIQVKNLSKIPGLVVGGSVEVFTTRFKGDENSSLRGVVPKTDVRRMAVRGDSLELTIPDLTLNDAVEVKLRGIPD